MLRKITLKPGLDKQSSDTGAESRWVNGDYMRFRYSYPEKIGGWQQLTSSNLVGAGRDQHALSESRIPGDHASPGLHSPYGELNHEQPHYPLSIAAQGPIPQAGTS